MSLAPTPRRSNRLGWTLLVTVALAWAYLFGVVMGWWV